MNIDLIGTSTIFSPHDPKKLYVSSNYLHLSEDGGQSWNTIFLI